MKAFIKYPRAPARRAGLILLFDGEVGPQSGTGNRLCRFENHDEHCLTDILTPGLQPRSRLPGPLFDQWLWESVARYSGATVPDSHGVP